MKQPLTRVDTVENPLAPDTIIDCNDSASISFSQLIKSFGKARLIYIGERHNVPAHHEIQLRIIKAMKTRDNDVSVGMEMFDYTYQTRLDQWTASRMDWPVFLKEVHWYANWKYEDSLYKDILMYIKEQRIRLVGLNIPFHLPAKIFIGGLDSLLPMERTMLPDVIDTTNEAHRIYMEKIYKAHHIKGRENFKFFYEAQCAWEDGMAANIVNSIGDGNMIVLAGNGHIIHKFGIPDRVYARNQQPFITVYLAYPGEKVTYDYADFIWVTGPAETVDMM